MTNSTFTSGAKKLAKVTSTYLWDRDTLRDMMEQNNSTNTAKSTDFTNTTDTQLWDRNTHNPIIEQNNKTNETTGLGITIFTIILLCIASIVLIIIAISKVLLYLL